MSPEEKADFLGRLEIFSELEEDELLDLARIAHEYEFDDGATIAYQRDIAEEFIIVVEGRLFASQVDGQGVVRDSCSYFPEEYLSDTWLFTPQAHPATVQGVEPGRLLTIRREDFLELLSEYDYLVDYLELSDEALDVVEQMHIGGAGATAADLSLTPEEQVLYRERRSGWRLFFELIVPLVILLGWTVFILVYASLPSTWAALLVLLPGLLVTAIIVWRTLDWANDYFVITSKHLVHHEYSLRGFQVVVVKVPVDQVQSVEIEKPSLGATLLGVGTAAITTAAATGAIRFDWIDDPQEVADIIDELREQAKEVDAGQTQAAMRAALEEYYQSDPAYRKVELPDEELAEDDQYEDFVDFGDVMQLGLRGMKRRIGRFFGTRLVDGDVITYRKHPFTLFVRTWWHWLLIFVSIAVATRIQNSFVSAALGLLSFILVLWLVWRYLDWRNDLFLLTNRYVFDIDRLPLGFGESRKQAELGNIQNVNAERPGLLPTILNFGNVAIETAGASADIVFEKVSNPSRVQSEIFQRRDAFLSTRRTADRVQRRKEFAVMLDVYQQAQEAGRIPRRMPPPEDP